MHVQTHVWNPATGTKHRKTVRTGSNQNWIKKGGLQARAKLNLTLEHSFSRPCVSVLRPVVDAEGREGWLDGSQLAADSTSCVTSKHHIFLAWVPSRVSIELGGDLAQEPRAVRNTCKCNT